MDQGSYPQLRQYLKGAALADTIRMLKQPTFWLRCVAAGVFGVAFVDKNVPVILISAIVLIVVGDRRGRRVLNSYLTDGPPAEALRRKVKSRLAKGRLEELVGGDTAAELERCATAARQIMALAVTRALSSQGLPRSTPESRRVTAAAEAEMDEAFRSIWRSLIFNLPPEAQGKKRIAEIRESLERFTDVFESDGQALPEFQSQSQVGLLLEEIEARKQARIELGP